MLEFDATRCLVNARQSTTEDLLDRVTVFRNELEPEAVSILESVLYSRGISQQTIAHLTETKPRLLSSAGYVYKCAFCNRPAIERGWGWHKLWGKLPIFPRHFRWCEEHLPKGMDV